MTATRLDPFPPTILFRIEDLRIIFRLLRERADQDNVEALSFKLDNRVGYESASYPCIKE